MCPAIFSIIESSDNVHKADITRLSGNGFSHQSGLAGYCGKLDFAGRITAIRAAPANVLNLPRETWLPGSLSTVGTTAVNGRKL